MKSTNLYIIGTIVLLLIGGFLLFSGSSTSGNSISGLGSSGDVQEVVIGMKNYQYSPNTVTVKAGQPVEIRLDDTVYGCFRDFTIRGLGIHEYLATPKDTVKFVPEKPGKYTFACSMGMGYGTLIVE